MIRIHTKAVDLDIQIPDTDTLALAYVLMLGLGDAAITTMAWHLEANPLVLGLGLEGWLAVKALAIAAFIPSYWIAREHWLATPIVAAGALIGALAVVSNLLVLGVVG